MLNFLDKNKYLLGRISFFIVFFWYGYLKVAGVSPAEGVVKGLFDSLSMGSVIDFDTFFYGLGIYEMIIGIGFLIGKFKKIILTLFLIHMFTTFGPMVFDMDATWQSVGVLTLAGQYIVKNLVFAVAGIYVLGGKK